MSIGFAVLAAAFVVGMLLATKYKFHIVFPVAIMIVSVLVMIGIARQVPGFELTLWSTGIVVAINSGYFAELVLSHFVKTSRSHKPQLQKREL